MQTKVFDVRYVKDWTVSLWYCGKGKLLNLDDMAIKAQVRRFWVLSPNICYNRNI